ncbi:5700_t:CDS:10 [Scutellospora calospora]|uniref:5700_t:CDS:1 n=1 Tax=Scutellospora calospora TaxID=85575 RepID=A0ACA9KII0_9GLOM|nr:5700_t:CDS:10 [Scutellospora calospora]
MHLAKPNDKNQRTSIFSVHVHPDGSRLATGGLDNKIKLWSTASIIDVDKANDPSVPRLLCTLGLHNGSVLCVRWSSKDGRYLASGSDDQLVLIWEWDRSTEGWSGGSVFGSGEHNIENWKPVKRLSGHQSDVVDLAWSRTNTYLASCGLDSLVFIWDGKTFDQHLGFVKGVTWDPVGEYLATESDDKTVKIWRTTDWTVQAEISEPYASSPTTTFYRRLSWSPDGSHVATANGAQGAVAIAAIFNRGEWRTDISLVGHDSAIEVVAFNPVIFMIPDSDDADPNSETMGSVCAVGSQDHSISVWVTRNARPLFVCQKPFEHSVLDLAWSPDGTQLYACSYDGTVVVLQFINKEFGTRVSDEEHEKLLTKYGFTAKEPIILESTTQLSLESEYAIVKSKEKSDLMANMMAPLDSPTVDMDISTSETNKILTTGPTITDFRPTVLPEPLPSIGTQQSINYDSEMSTNTNGVSTSAPNTTVNVAISQQTVTVTKDGKRRIQPQFLKSLISSTPHLQPNISSTSEQVIVEPSTSSNGSTIVSALPNSHQKLSTEDILGSEMDAPSRALPPGGIPTLIIGNKRSTPPTSDTTTQSNKRQNISGKIQSEVEPQSSVLRSSLVSPSVAMSQVRLATHKVLNYLAKDRLDGATLKLECYNSSDNSPSQLMCTRGKATVWFDYVPSAVILITGHSQYSAVACEDGSIYIYSSAGRRLLPVIVLESSASFLEICRDYLLVLTQVGLLSVWDLRNLKAIVHSVSIAPILYSASLNSDDFNSSVSIISAHVRSNGIPLLITSTNEAWCYHFDMHVWTRVYDPRYTSKDSTGSEIGEVNGGGILASLENYARQGGVRNLGSLSHLRRLSGNDTPGQPNHQIGYLETQLVAAELVNSPVEYKKLLFQYAQKIADEEAEYRTEDFGGRAKSNWDPFLMGMSKRQLLEEVLTVLSSNRSLQRHVTEYKNALNKVLNLD